MKYVVEQKTYSEVRETKAPLEVTLITHLWPGNDCGIPLLNYIYSISSGAQNVTLQKYFSHPRLVIYIFATPPI